jgi:hypothetical protein
MAIQVTGFFPNPNNDSYVKDAVITLNVKQVPMGRLDVECQLCVEKEITNPGNITSNQLMNVSVFSVNDIDRAELSFDVSLTDPYEQLLSSVQDFLIEKFTTENPDLTFETYVQE